MDNHLIRNFCIIAHVDHGKTTLSDRLLEATATLSARELQNQTLDSMDLERERGITIKSHPVSMSYSLGANHYLLNLIDTPGHVDFSHEVSRSLGACEGAILLIDATQGVQAQTLATAQLALEQKLQLLTVINKIDLPAAELEKTHKQIEETLNISPQTTLVISAKTGLGIQNLLENIIAKLPPPPSRKEKPLKALLFDSVYDPWQGVIAYVRVFDGQLQTGDEIYFMRKKQKTTIKELGRFTPHMHKENQLENGCTGYIITSIKALNQISMGDTLTHFQKQAATPLKAYQPTNPTVFSGLYPLDSSDYLKLKNSISKLQLNDSALTFQTESSPALGFGLRCGFLGLLHMEIVQERLRREYQLDILCTYPSVIYKIHLKNGKTLEIDNPNNWPENADIDLIEEPTITATIHTPSEFIGATLQLISKKRGHCYKTESLPPQRVTLECQLPLNEILLDFNDRLKSLTRGYGSIDYQLSTYTPAKLVKLNILINEEPIDAFSSIIHADKAESKGRELCERLKTILPRQLFKLPIQAAIYGKIIARETLPPMRKDVTAKCYGGDITRKRKLLEKQKKGKKRMKQFGKVAIPQEAFTEILKPKNKTKRTST